MDVDLDLNLPNSSCTHDRYQRHFFYTSMMQYTLALVLFLCGGKVRGRPSVGYTVRLIINQVIRVCLHTAHLQFGGEKSKACYTPPPRMFLLHHLTEYTTFYFT